MLTDLLERVLGHMGRTALRDLVHKRHVALHHRWMIESAPIFGRIARRIAPELARRVVPREAVEPTPDWTSTAEEMIRALSETAVWKEWRTLLGTAWREALAEGSVEAMAWLQQLRGEVISSLDVSFSFALDALRTTDWEAVDGWMTQITHGMAYSAAQAVADGLEAGESYSDLALRVTQAIGDPTGDAVVVTNEMLSTGISQGTLSRYEEEDVERCDILISPGACVECEALAGENPWLIADADGELPAHINCRCTWAPTT